MAEQDSDSEETPEANPRLTQVLENLDAEITCSVCHDYYREPKLLPCNHYFCKKCICDIAEHAKGKPFACPLCSVPTSLPLGGGADSLKPAYFVEKMRDVIEAVDFQKTELRSQKPMCDLCRKGIVDTYCRICDKFLCASCSRTHHTMAQFSRHPLISWEDLKRKRERGSFASFRYAMRTDSISSVASTQSVSVRNTEGRKPTQRMTCTKHDDQIRLYCFECDVLICRDCTVFDHKSHNYEFIRTCAPKMRQALTDALAQLKKAKLSVEASQNEVKSIRWQVELQEGSLLETTKGTFDQLKSQVDSCKAVLHHSITVTAESKKTALANRKEALLIWMTEVEGTIDSVQQDLDNLSNEELMSTQRYLHMLIEKERARHRNRPLDPPTLADMICSSPSLDALPTGMGFCYPKSELPLLHVNPPKMANFSVGKTLKYRIVVPHSFHGKLEIELNSSVDPQCVVHADVLHLNEIVQHGIVVDSYEVKLTPRVRGSHALKTKINGCEIPSSPLDVFVKIDPQHLGFVVRESEKIGKPYGIALMPDGRLVVAENGWKNLKFMGRDLKEPHEIIRSEKFRFPRGVAVGPDGAVYSTDQGIEKGKEYTLLKFVKGHLVKGSNFGSRSVRLMKIIKKRLYVADQKFSQVHVFSFELDHIATFNTGKASDTHDVAEFDDLLYVVSGAERGCQIAVYTLDGKYLHLVPVKDVSLSVIRGICFDSSGNMFITQAGSGVKGVYVFNPVTGDLLASFGQFMDHPCGIVIDEEGFVYITDHKDVKRRIFVF